MTYIYAMNVQVTNPQAVQAPPAAKHGWRKRTSGAGALLMIGTGSVLGLTRVPR